MSIKADSLLPAMPGRAGRLPAPAVRRALRPPPRGGSEANRLLRGAGAVGRGSGVGRGGAAGLAGLQGGAGPGRRLAAAVLRGRGRPAGHAVQARADGRVDVLADRGVNLALK